MKTWFYFGLFLFFFTEVYSLFPTRLEKAPSASFWKKGYFSLKTRKDGGPGEREEALRAASERDADFVIFTDGAAPAENWQGPNDRRLLVLAETEVETPSGWLTVFHSQTSARDWNAKAIARLGYRHFLGEESAPGLFVSVSHPSHPKKPWTQLDRFPDGIEIVNFESQFQRILFDSPVPGLATLALAPLNAYLASLRFQKPYPKDLSAWDAMNAVSPGHFGLLASDPRPLVDWESLPFTWPSFSSVFALGSNRVFISEPWADDPALAQGQLYRAIRRGSSAVSFDNVFPFAGNDFYLECGLNRFRSGDRILPPGRCEFVVKLPEGLSEVRTVKLIKDGEVEAQATGRDSEYHFPLGLPGSYRAEVWVNFTTRFHLLLRRPVPYVFYNPVYVR